MNLNTGAEWLLDGSLYTLFTAFAAYALAGIFTSYKVFEGTRATLTYHLLFKRGGKASTFILRVKLAELINCPLCLGIWLTPMLMATYMWCWPWVLGVQGWLLTLAAAGLQCFLQSRTRKV